MQTTPKALAVRWPFPIASNTNNISSFFKTSKFSDLIIQTGDQEFKVHKIVVCGQSEYFARLLSGNWKVGKDDVNVKAVFNSLGLSRSREY